jgi:hypothetical protein
MQVPRTPYTFRVLSPATPFFFLPVCVALVPVKVVVLKPTPFGPIVIVCPLYTSVVGFAPAPNVNVVPPITTSEEPISEKVIPPAVTACVVGLKGKVKVAPPTPSPVEAIVKVCPFRTVVVGVALGPMVIVTPSTTARVEPSSVIERPPTIPSWVPVGWDGPPRVVPSKETPDGPMVIVSPFTTSVVTGTLGPYVNVDPLMTATVLPIAENTCPSTTTNFRAPIELSN